MVDEFEGVGAVSKRDGGLNVCRLVMFTRFSFLLIFSFSVN